MTFPDLTRYQAEVGCTCPLVPAMSYRELVDMGEGCTRGHGTCASWVCAALSRYREDVRRKERAA